MKWVEVQIKTTTEAEELVTNIMYDLGVTGLAIEDPNDILAFQQVGDNWDFIDPNLVNQDYEGVIIKAYFPEDKNILDRIEAVRECIERTSYNKEDKCLGEISLKEVYEKDWAEAWKKHYKPIKIGDRIVVKPTWEDYEHQGDDIIIELDPGMAFGTGTHETTAMCIEALEGYLNQGETVFDIGCGSGILSIAAAKLGAKKVIAVDIDDICTRVCRDNIRINGIEDIVEIRLGNLFNKIDGKSNLIVSNIIAETIVDMIAGIENYLLPGGIFIASGIIADKLGLVEESLRENRFEIIEIKHKNDWALIVSILK